MHDIPPTHTPANPVLPVTQGQQALTSEFTAAHAEAPVVLPSGGDFLSTFPLDDGKGSIGIIVGDVSGHGPEKTPQASQLRDELEESLKQGFSPVEVLEQANESAEQSSDFHGFATVFVGALEGGTGKLTYASGGHEPALVATPQTDSPDSVVELDSTGPPVGAVPAELATYHEEKTHIPEAGTLLVFTDGVSDVRHADDRRKWLGVDRLKSLFALFCAFSPARLVTKIVQYIQAFSRGRLSDDVALLAIRRSDSAHSSNKPLPISEGESAG